MPNGESIYDFLKSRFDAVDGYPSDLQIPDEEAIRAGGIGWAPGAFDGVARRFGAEDAEDQAQRLSKPLTSTTRRPSARNLRTLHDAMAQRGVVDYIDKCLESPVTRNRNGALRALQAWPRTEWPEGAHELVSRMAISDPNERAREFAVGTLASATPSQ